MKILLITTFILIIQCVYGLPRLNRDVDSLNTKYAGISSQILTINLLKDKIDLNRNQVFSPIGISQILAILAEGARNDVYKEFIDALSYPNDKKELRLTFEKVLKNFKNDLSDLKYPAFKTWFYIYPNNTIREDFKNLLLNYYYVDVKNIENTYFIDNNNNNDDDKPLTPTQIEKIRSLLQKKMTQDEYEKFEKKLIEEKENLKNISIYVIDNIIPPKYVEYVKDAILQSELSLESSTTTTTKTTAQTGEIKSSTINSKDVIDFEELKKSEPFNSKDNNENEKLQQKDASKFDEVVDDKQYVEVPVIIEEMNKNEKEEKKDEMNSKEEKSEEKRKQDSEKQEEINQIPELKEKIPLIRDVKEKNNYNGGSNKDKEEMKIKPENMMVIENIQSPEAIASLSLSSSSAVVPAASSKEQNLQDNETIKDDEKLEAYKKDMVEISKLIKQSPNDINEPKKISLPLKKLVEILENDFLQKKYKDINARSLFGKDDIASSLSANSFITRGILKNKNRMILFSGLYYRGNWAYPFQELKSDDDYSNKGEFYISEDKKIPVTLMRSEGTYRIADLERLGAQMIEFPYENRQYSLLVLLPNEKQGLRSLIENLEINDIINTKTKLNDTLLEISLPKFQIEQTTHTEDTLKRLGLKSIFLSELGGLDDISDNLQMNVDEIVQHVNVRVDEGAGSSNVFSATSLESRSSTKKDTEDSNNNNNEIKSELEIKKILIDRPFLYFIFDNENDFILVAGKVYDPNYSEYDTI